MKTLARTAKHALPARKTVSKKPVRLTIAEWAKRVSGTANSGKGDLSTREGFGD